ncbi:MAG: hypothetical protein WCQ50_16985 [Spirochaetota bacterium]
MESSFLNLLTGKTYHVTAMADHPTSSYGRQVWVTDEGEALGEVGMPILGYTEVLPAS